MRTITTTLLLTLLLAFPLNAAGQVVFPNRGGTGTSTIPQAGQVLVGQPNGTYAPQATSTLGISGNSIDIEEELLEGYDAILGNATTTNLSVTGTFSFLGTLISDVATWFNGLFNTQFATKDTDDLQEGTTNLYSQWDNATGGINYAGGNVGIGTTTPNGKLHVSGTNGDWYIGTDGNTQYFTRPNTNYIIGSQAGGNFAFVTDGRAPSLTNANLALKSDQNSYFNGSLGVGTTDTATARLVAGTIGTGVQNIINLANPQTAASGVGSQIGFYGAGGAYQSTIQSVWEDAGSNAYLRFANRRAGTVTEALRITGSGNVGIGTTNPGSKLTVTGSSDIVQASIYANGTQTADLQRWYDSSGVRRAAVSSTGDMVVYDSSGATKAFFHSGGGYFYGTGISNLITGNNSTVLTSLTGTQITRNIADANPALTVTQTNSGSTGDIAQFKNNTGTVASINQAGGLNFKTYAFRKIVVEGDSLSNDIIDWPGYIDDASPYFQKATLVRVATAGETTSDMVSDYATEVAPHAPSAAGDDYWFFIMGGINDLASGTAATDIYDNLKTLWASARADGFKVVAFTVMHSTVLTSGEEDERLALNNLIMSDPSLYDYVVRPDLVFDPRTTSSYFADATHLNTTGAGLLAELIEKSISVRPYSLSTSNATTTNPVFDVGFHGSVGIGTSSPATALSVVGTTTTDGLRVSGLTSCDTIDTNANGDFICGTDGGGGSSQWTTSGNDIYYNTGNVGIGTSTPAYPFHILKHAGGNIAKFDSGASVGQIIVSATTGNTYIGNGTGFKAYFGVYSGLSANNLVVDASGRVGIGTTTPTTRLAVVGTTTTDVLCLASDCRSSWPSGGSVSWGDITGTLSNQTDLQTALDAKQDILDPTPDSDLSGNGKVVTVTMDTNATGAGALLFLASDGNYEEADADATSTMPVRALALESGTGSKDVLLEGYFRNDAWNWTPGVTLYASTTAGAITATPPSGTGDQIQAIGYAVSADVIYFDPDLTVIEI